MVLIAVRCLYCQGDQGTKRGKATTGKQRYRCHNPDYTHLGRHHDVSGDIYCRLAGTEVPEPQHPVNTRQNRRKVQG